MTSVKKFILKKQNRDICSAFSVDSWKEIEGENCDGIKTLKDIYDGKEIMKEVTEKKYLEDIISNDGKK